MGVLSTKDPTRTGIFSPRGKYLSKLHMTYPEFAIVGLIAVWASKLADFSAIFVNTDCIVTFASRPMEIIKQMINTSIRFCLEEFNKSWSDFLYSVEFSDVRQDQVTIIKYFVQECSQLYSLRWASVSLSSFFLKFPQFFLIFPQTFLISVLTLAHCVGELLNRGRPLLRHWFCLKAAVRINNNELKMPVIILLKVRFFFINTEFQTKIMFLVINYIKLNTFILRQNMNSLPNLIINANTHYRHSDPISIFFYHA